MVYKVRKSETFEDIAGEIASKKDAMTFAVLYSRGSENTPSCNVWVYEVEPMYSEIAIAYVVGGTVFKKENDK